MNEHSPLTNEELEILWREAWRQARILCRSTIARLNAGHGGFYDADDLHQDLFLGFRKLALAWAAEDPRPHESELWAKWRGLLRYSGMRFCRRAPQRLWRGVMLQWPSEAFTLDTDDQTSWLSDDLAAQITQTEDAQTTLERNETREKITKALASLPLSQRHLLLLVGHGWPLHHIAQKLGVPYGQVLYQRLYRARRALRRALQQQEEEG